MAFQLTTGDIEAEIDIRKGASLSEAVSQALDNKAVRELIGQTVEKYARDVFDNDGEPSSDWLEKCAQAFILGGRDAVEDHIRASFEHPSAVDHAAGEARGDSTIEELVDDLVDGLRGVRREKSSAIRDAIASLDGVEGVTGKISYVGTQGMPLRSVSLVRIEGGNRSLVSKGTPAAADIPAP